MPPLLPQEVSRRPYFAYGSNMVLTQMQQRCPAAQDMGIARLDGWRWRINQHGYATIVPEQSAYVLGVLWSLTSACEAALDDYEERLLLDSRGVNVPRSSNSIVVTPLS